MRKMTPMEAVKAASREKWAGQSEMPAKPIGSVTIYHRSGERWVTTSEHEATHMTSSGSYVRVGHYQLVPDDVELVFNDD